MFSNESPHSSFYGINHSSISSTSSASSTKLQISPTFVRFPASSHHKLVLVSEHVVYHHIIKWFVKFWVPLIIQLLLLFHNNATTMQPCQLLHGGLLTLISLPNWSELLQTDFHFVLIRNFPSLLPRRMLLLFYDWRNSNNQSDDSKDEIRLCS